jgi:5-methylcytosine-specific restriction endonuclease McrA
MAPFTIRLVDRLQDGSNLQPLRLKLDPGSKTTGFAILREVLGDEAIAIILGEIRHKLGIKQKLDSRRALRRGRRNRHTRYRIKRFDNRKRNVGWLPPSLEARVNQTLNAVAKLRKLLPITSVSSEHVKFDTQLLQNPDIQGVEYQQGTLFGYEVREYLLERDGHACRYCNGLSKDPVLEVEHKIPKSRDGSSSIRNLVMACHACNEKKDDLTPEEWLTALKGKDGPSAVNQKRIANLDEIVKNKVVPLKDAAMMNATRWKLYRKLQETGLPVECGTGARTKKQRIDHKLPKAHYFDACCVGASTPDRLDIATKYVEVWSAKGRGTRQMCNVNKFGFPISHRTRQKQFFGFQTGDLVKATVPKGKYTGIWTSRVMVRAKGNFDIKDASGNRMTISHRYIQLLQRNDGWLYEKAKIG